MKFAFLNPTVIALDDVPQDVFDKLYDMVHLAHTHSDHDDSGNPQLSVRGGQQIQLVPNEFGLDTDVLKEYIEKIAQEYLDSIQQQNPLVNLASVKPLLISAWTIKQGPGDYQALHSHESNLSGNIYIDVPVLENAKPSDSQIEFKLPMTKDIAHFIFSDSWRFQPEKGKMIVFPGHIPHTVYPWNGQGHRIVLAWDVQLVDRAVDIK
jgi:hypothetical protein